MHCLKLRCLKKTKTKTKTKNKNQQLFAFILFEIGALLCITQIDFMVNNNQGESCARILGFNFNCAVIDNNITFFMKLPQI